MPKSKTFKSDHDGPITVSVPGREPIDFKPGSTHETDEADVIAVLEANPDVSEVKGSRGKK